MTVGLNAAQARAKSQQDMIIYDEVHAIMSAILESSANGTFEATVSDNTTMTESTPSGTKIGTVVDPVILANDTIILNGVTVTLGTSGNNLNAIIADINDAGITGVVAGKDSGYITLTFESQLGDDWTYEINPGGSAVVKLGLAAGVYNIPRPVSNDYFAVWQGTDANRALLHQINSVEKYFNNMGYKIQKVSNTRSNNTFSWNIYW